MKAINIESEENRNNHQAIIISKIMALINGVIEMASAYAASGHLA
jgi:hypothetical protein